jgi:hypothetical protein
MERHPPSKERSILDKQRLAKRLFDVDPLVADVGKKSLSHRLDRKLRHGPTVPAQNNLQRIRKSGAQFRKPLSPSLPSVESAYSVQPFLAKGSIAAKTLHHCSLFSPAAPT